MQKNAYQSTHKLSLLFSKERHAHGLCSASYEGLSFFHRKFQPPLETPIRMAADQAIGHVFSINSYSEASGTYTEAYLDANFSKHYFGREKLSVPQGNFETCKFKDVRITADKNTPEASTRLEEVVWVAASGKYRGLTLSKETTETTPQPRAQQRLGSDPGRYVRPQIASGPACRKPPR